jgi:hypothetical protein
MVKYVVKLNSRNKRFMVFAVPEKKGLWRIVRACKTKSEADKWVKGKK